jgi:hypothetical protein
MAANTVVALLLLLRLGLAGVGRTMQTNMWDTLVSDTDFVAIRISWWRARLTLGGFGNNSLRTRRSLHSRLHIIRIM